MKAQAGHKEISDKEIWNESRVHDLREHIIRESKKQSPERKLRNELLSIQYKLEDYVSQGSIDAEVKPLDFVKMYLKALNITKKKLAAAFEMRDSNLQKYLTGERKLNPDIVLKLSAFSHTKPELWYLVQAKNELHKLEKTKDKLKQYEKYSYTKIVADKEISY